MHQVDTLFLSFHPFRNDLKVETLTQVDDGIGDLCVFLVGQKVTNELLVDLEMVHRQPLQVRQ